MGLPISLNATGLAVFGVAAVLGYDFYDKSANYVHVKARVRTVTEQCYMEKVDRGIMTKTTSTSDLLPCDVAAVMVANHPNWAGYSIRKKIEVAYLYTSPVDGKTHDTVHRMTSYPRDRKYGVGDVVEILASKSAADKTRDL